MIAFMCPYLAKGKKKCNPMSNCKRFTLFLAHGNHPPGSYQSIPAHFEKEGRVDWGKWQRWGWQKDTEVKVPSERDELYPATVKPTNPTPT